MKKYPKTYENLFSTDRPKSTTKFFIEGTSADGMELDEYTLLFKDFLKEFYFKLFDYCVKLSWLRRKYIYKGNKLTIPMNENAITSHIAFVKFLRRVIGKDIQIITRWKFFSKIELYFDELFPGFDEGNPFENPDYYKFPFKHVTIDFLMVVFQLDERIALLKYADEQKMAYAEFVDYIINHVLSANEELGRDRYQMRLKNDRNFPFYVKDTDKEKKKYRRKII